MLKNDGREILTLLFLDLLLGFLSFSFGRHLVKFVTIFFKLFTI